MTQLLSRSGAIVLLRDHPSLFAPARGRECNPVLGPETPTNWQLAIEIKFESWVKTALLSARQKKSSWCGPKWAEICGRSRKPAEQAGKELTASPIHKPRVPSSLSGSQENPSSRPVSVLSFSIQSLMKSSRVQPRQALRPSHSFSVPSHSTALLVSTHSISASLPSVHRSAAESPRF